MIISIVSFLGCFGAANEKGMLLKTYFAILVILVILELSIGFAAYGKKETIEGLVSDQWRSSTSAEHNSTIYPIERTVLIV